MTELPPGISLHFEARPSFLLAEVNGDRDSLEITLAFWTRIAAEVRARRTRNLLVLDNLGEFEGERNMQTMVEGIIALGFEDVRVAYVHRSLAHLSQHEHGAILAQERGMDARVFGSVPDAQNWLKHA